MIHGINVEVDCVDDGDDCYYELHIHNECVNLGNPFYVLPSKTQIENFLISNNILQDFV
jgi:hypothetical protein